MPTETMFSRWKFDWVVLLGNILSVICFFPAGLFLFMAFLTLIGIELSSAGANYFLEYFIVGVPVSIVASHLIQSLGILWLARIVSFGTFFAYFVLEIVPPMW